MQRKRGNVIVECVEGDITDQQGFTGCAMRLFWHQSPDCDRLLTCRLMEP